jgi:hypothetical protein
MQAIWRTVRAQSEQILDWVMLTIIFGVGRASALVDGIWA